MKKPSPSTRELAAVERTATAPSPMCDERRGHARRRDDRAHVRALLVAGADGQAAGALGERGDEPVRRLLADGDDGGDGHAALAGAAVGGGGDGVGGDVEVGVGQDDGVVLRAAERLHALAVGVAVSWTCLAIGVEPTKDTASISRVREQRVDRLLVAVDDLEGAVGQPGLAASSRAQEQRRARVALGRLEDEGVAARERDREHPHRDHAGEVERRDAGDDAERLALARRVHARGDLLGRLALHQVRDAAGELDDLEAALDLAARVVERLAVLGGDGRGELAGARGERLAETRRARSCVWPATSGSSRRTPHAPQAPRDRRRPRRPARPGVRPVRSPGHRPARRAIRTAAPARRRSSGRRPARRHPRPGPAPARLR